MPNQSIHYCMLRCLIDDALNELDGLRYIHSLGLIMILGHLSNDNHHQAPKTDRLSLIHMLNSSRFILAYEDMVNL